MGTIPRKQIDRKEIEDSYLKRGSSTMQMGEGKISANLGKV